MSTLKTREIKNGLLKKGFQELNNHHKYYVIIINNKKTSIKTKISHGDKEINEFLLRQMASQTGLSNADFIDLINCPLSLEQYINLLKDRKKISC